VVLPLCYVKAAVHQEESLLCHAAAPCLCNSSAVFMMLSTALDNKLCSPHIAYASLIALPASGCNDYCSIGQRVAQKTYTEVLRVCVLCAHYTLQYTYFTVYMPVLASVKQAIIMKIATITAML
jgi:hypothetical protein